MGSDMVVFFDPAIDCGFVTALYQSGAWLVFLADLTGCLPQPKTL